MKPSPFIVPPGATVEFICADPDLDPGSARQPSAMPAEAAELANCRDFAQAVAVFTRAGRSKTDAIRLVIAAAPTLYATYRKTGGPV